MTDNLFPQGNPIVYRIPHRLTDIRSWHCHIPFAFFVVSLLHPKTLVELGTYMGDSYCAFCQAAEELGIKVSCYAIDTWQGDEQAGFYGSEVLNNLRAYHDRKYGGFSQLIQSTFDDALPYFADGSIDLLHIDGLHSYDAVKHDFESWLPKVSRRGLILMHDINVREKGFGVWRLWEEVSAVYLARSFAYGHGLGILGVGDRLDGPVQEFLSLRGREWQMIEAFFYSLGHRVELLSLAVTVEREMEELRQEAQKSREKAERYREEAEAAREKAQRDEIQLRALRRKVGQYERFQAEAAELRKQVAAWRLAAEERLAELGVLTSTLSWRITSPLRLLRKIQLGLMRHVARAYKRPIAEAITEQSSAVIDDTYFRFVFERSKRLSEVDTFVPYRSHHITEIDIKIIAFYLPQFHPIPENDFNWEKGFTEWTNVTRAVPQFFGHYQPHLPIDIGFYDLRLLEPLRRQIDLAKNYGIYGFCFHHYWFSGKKVMRTPLENFFAHKELDFKFCLNWANENWTRQWDGCSQEILLKQCHSPEDDIAFIKDIDKFLRDPRYIRVQGRPLLIVYRPSLLPDPWETAGRWRKYCRETGIGDLYLACIHSFEQDDPREIGFDVAIEFAPNLFDLDDITGSMNFVNKNFAGHVSLYDSVLNQARSFVEPEYRKYRSVCPSWDNEPRRPGRGHIIHGSSPAKYREWLREVCEYTQSHFPPSERLIFVNAWNEWAEGAHLEPDRRFGYGYLEATATILEEYAQSAKKKIVFVSHDAYEHGAQLLALNIVKTLVKHFNMNVVTILREGGELQEQFAKYSQVVEWFKLTPEERDESISLLLARGFKRAICNTSAVGDVAECLKKHGFVITALIHELRNIMTEMNLLPSAQALAYVVDSIICATPEVAENFVSLTAADRRKVRIRPQGIYYRNHFDRESARCELMSRYHLPADAFVVLNAGYGDFRKGFDLFTSIGRNVIRSHKNAYFVWAGKIASEMRERFLATMEPETAEHFICPGFVRDLGWLYYAGDVFLLTSREDPFPSVVMEAMEAGMPVVAFADAGGASGLLASGGGILVPFEDIGAAARAISELIQDTVKRTSMSEQARQTVADRFDFLDYVYDLLNFAGYRTFKVSVIVLSYNYERYLQERFKSIVDQTLRPYEIIFLDDGSKDNSVATAREALSRTGIPHRIIENKENQGCFSQWVRGIELAHGDLVWIAEADDFCQENFLEELVPAFEDDEVVISYCDSQIIDENSNILPGDYTEWLGDISHTKWKQSYNNSGYDEVASALCIKNTIPNASAVVMRKSALSGIGQHLCRFTTSGDWFTYVYALQHGSIFYNATKLNYHRRHGKSIIATSAASYAHFDEYLTILEYIVEHFTIAPFMVSRSMDFIDLLYKSILAAETGFPDIFVDPRYRDRIIALKGKAV